MTKEQSKQYEKCFYEESTKKVYKTLKEAKAVTKYANVHRCWMKDGEITAMHYVTDYGEPMCTIKKADQYIMEAIDNGTVGEGKRCQVIV